MASLVDPSGGEATPRLAPLSLVPRRKNSGRRQYDDIHQAAAASGDEGLVSHDARCKAVLIAELRETARVQTDLHRAEKRLLLQIGAIGRRMVAAKVMLDSVLLMPQLDGEAQNSTDTQGSVGLAVLPLETARLVIHKARLPLRKRMEQMAKQLPVWPLWAEQIRGFGAFGLAQIVGETGDLANYANPAKVWKRMGLAVIGSERQRKVVGDDAILHGYSPHRRAIMWNVGQSLIKGNRDGLYKRCYDERKEYERARDPDGPPIKHHARAQRYMEKRLLRELWKAWRDAAASFGLQTTM